MALATYAELGAATGGGAGAIAIFAEGMKMLKARVTQSNKLDLIISKLVPNGGSSVLDAVVEAHAEVVLLRQDVQTEWGTSTLVHQQLQEQITALDKRTS